MARLVSLIVLAATLALAACAMQPNTAEDWLSGGTPDHAWTPIDPERRIDLPPESIPVAAGMLRQHDALQLDPETFARLVPGREYPSQTGRVPYLVRGVALQEPVGALRVMESGDELLVQYEGPRVRARAYVLPLIVLLPAAPSKLYVKISLFN